MITGSVNANHEAIIQMVVVGPGSQQQIEAVIDTGFSGHLTLPVAVIKLLQLTWLGRENALLADGSVDLFDVYSASVRWDGQERFIEVQAVETLALAGMDLLRGHSLRIDVVRGGFVSISPLP